MYKAVLYEKDKISVIELNNYRDIQRILTGPFTLDENGEYAVATEVKNNGVAVTINDKPCGKTIITGIGSDYELCSLDDSDIEKLSSSNILNLGGIFCED